MPLHGLPIINNALTKDVSHKQRLIGRLLSLQEIVGDEALYEQYLLEVLLGHSGWSGMVRVIETNPQALLAQCDISLTQLLAVELACELAFVTKRKGKGFIKIAQLPNSNDIPLLSKARVKPDILMNIPYYTVGFIPRLWV